MGNFFISDGSVRKRFFLVLGRGQDSGRVRMARLAIAILLVGSASFAGNVNAGQRTGPFRIGQLTESWGPTPVTIGLRDGLQELGYRENEDFVIGIRFTQGNREALPLAARELVRLGVDLIFMTGIHGALADRKASSEIPIVFAGGIGDPVELGLVQSFARPGGNITGVTDLDLELGPKRLEIFRQIIPGLKRVMFLCESTDPYIMAAANAYRKGARRLGILVVGKAVRTQKDARAALAEIRKGENPSKIPVEANPEIEFAINLKTAQNLGLTIAPPILYRASRLIQ